MSLNGVWTPAPVAILSRRISGALDLSIHATQPWVLSIRSATSNSVDQKSQVAWSSSPTGAFTPLTTAGTVVAAGISAHTETSTAVYFAPASTLDDPQAAPVVVTVAAP